MACDVDVRERAWVMSCLSFACGEMNRGEWRGWFSRTSNASISSDATSLDGALRLCCADIRVMRSDICCKVGPRLVDARFNASRVPAVSEGKFSTSKKIRV